MIVRIPSFSSDFPERCEKRCVSHVLPPKQISNAPFLVRNPGITREMVRFSFTLAESHEKWCVSRLLWRNHTRKGAFLVCFGGITREMLRFSFALAESREKCCVSHVFCGDIIRSRGSAHIPPASRGLAGISLKKYFFMHNMLGSLQMSVVSRLKSTFSMTHFSL